MKIIIIIAVLVFHPISIVIFNNDVGISLKIFLIIVYVVAAILAPIVIYIIIVNIDSCFIIMKAAINVKTVAL